MIKRAPLGACGPMPRPSRVCTWPLLIALTQEAVQPPPPVRAPLPSRCTVPLVTPAWEKLDLESSADMAAWPENSLSVPEARNHRFFVQDMREFAESVAPWEGHGL